MRVSVTTIEAYRLYLSTDWMTFEKLKEQLEGDFVENDLMRRGKSFHKLMEIDESQRNILFGFGDEYHTGSFRWNKREINRIDSSADDKELKCEMVHNTSYGDVTVVGKVDAIKDDIIIDYKVTDKSFSADKYFDSCQWKFYCHILDIPRFSYRVFKVKNDMEEYDLASRIEPGAGDSIEEVNRNLNSLGLLVNIQEEHNLNLHVYPSMINELEFILEDFVSFCKKNRFYKALGEMK